LTKHADVYSRVIGGISVPSVLEDFGVFAQEKDGPLWRGSAATLEEARAKAEQLAIEEDKEFFVFSFKDASEVARCFPKPRTSRT
jgi:hypothetical protein